jgi:death-on-curing protein
MSLNDNKPIKPIRYLAASELYQINDEVTGGNALVRDIHLLNSAAVRPTIMLFGEEQFPTIIDKAASLLHSLTYHHLFADGNKRTALRAVTMFLDVNGYQLTWDDKTEYDFILEIAQGKYDVAEVAAQLGQYIQPAK